MKLRKRKSMQPVQAKTIERMKLEAEATDQKKTKKKSKKKSDDS